jgi:hypothetical protein
MNQTTAHNMGTRSRRASLRVARPAPASKFPAIDLYTSDSADRKALEACIATRFENEHSAQIRHFLPYLLSLSQAGELNAVLGLRLARESRLFLERYLDSPVEQAVSQAFRMPIDREKVVEIGNLVATVPGTAFILFTVLAAALHRAGYRWVVCTATPQVRKTLDKMQFSSRTICEADPTRLGDAAAEWGRYYDSRPEVIVGDAADAAKRVASDRRLAPLAQQLSASIDRVAASIKCER